MKRRMFLLVSLFLAVVVMVPLSLAADSSAMVVGRIFNIEGDLLRYVPAEEDWVAVVRDAPFGAEDTLFSGSEGMAELIVPNGTWIRVGNNTQIQFIALDTDFSEMDVAAGIARFYNKSSNTVVKVTSPFGYVLAYPGAVFDFYVGENSVEAVAIKGKVDFIHAETDARYEIRAGSPSILADQNQVSSGEGTVDYRWNRWNTDRENFWAAKSRVRGRSAEYLPPSLREEAYAFEENGRWEDVSYEGERRRFWRPTTVAVGWSPFTVGRWTDWYGEQTWIPAEPFGYVTHHYGNWIYVGSYWYWAPPVVSVRVGLPFLDIGFFWYPGRVSWIHRGAYVGWVPLAPRETYYSHRHWGGPHDVVVTNVNIAQININLRNYAYVNRAIVVPQSDFYRVNNYRDVRVRNINRTTIVNNYSSAPVVNNTVINNYTTNRQRYNYTNVTVKEKPHNTVIKRIQHNETVIQGGRKENAAVVQERAKSIKEGSANHEARIEAPKVTNYIVPVREMNRPKSEIKLPQRAIKSSGQALPQVQQQQKQEEQRKAQEQGKQQQLQQQQKQEEQRKAQEQGKQQQLQQQQKQEQQRKAQEQGKQQQLQQQQKQEQQRKAQEQGKQQQLQQQQKQEEQRKAQEQGKQQQLQQQQKQEEQRKAQEQGKQQQLQQQQKQEEQRKVQEQGKQQQLQQQQKQEQQRKAQEQGKQQQLQQQQKQEEQRKAQEQGKQQQLQQEQKQEEQRKEQLREFCQQNPKDPKCK
ncbi:MAG: DUF6600 domain-containing protein [Syntrophales bacterium]